MPEFSHPEPTHQFAAFALFAGEPPSLDAVAAALDADFGESLATTEVPVDDATVPALVVDAQGARVVVVPVPEPVPDDVALNACHPVWWQDPAPVAGHAAHVVVTTVREPEAEADHEQLLAEAVALSSVAALVLELPDAVAVYYGNAGITFPAEPYVQLIRDSLENGQLPTEAWVSTWLARGDDERVGGCTLGLASFGHADLLVENSEHEASDVYQLLTGLGGQLIASGYGLQPGATVGPTEEEQYTVSERDAGEAGTLLQIAY